MDVPEQISEALWLWMSDQKYGDEALLHAAVCCDFVGVMRFKEALADIIRQHLPALPEQPNTCEWTEDEDGNWETACGRAWVFGIAGPKENRIKCCMECGKLITIKPATDRT